MKGNGFDALAGVLGSRTGRRAGLRMLAGGAFSSLGLTADHESAAKKKKKKKCRPRCGSRRCGSDGCGGKCGSCAGGTVCTGGQCSTYRFVTSWGGKGAGNGKFDGPIALATDGNVLVYVAENSSDRMQKFDSSGTFLTNWGSRGSSQGQFWSPENIAVDGAGNVYVADRYNNRIQTFDSNGVFLKALASVQGGISVYQPSAVAIGADGSIYYANSSFTTDVWHVDSSGDYISAWDLYAFGINDLALDADGNIFFALSMLGGDDVVRKLASNGALLAEWPLPGEFSSPEGLAIDGDGNVFVVDSTHSRVLKFTGDGTLLTQWGSEGNGPGEFDYPLDVAVDGDGNVYVADFGQNRVSKFAPVDGS